MDTGTPGTGSPDHPASSRQSPLWSAGRTRRSCPSVLPATRADNSRRSPARVGVRDACLGSRGSVRSRVPRGQALDERHEVFRVDGDVYASRGPAVALPYTVRLQQFIDLCADRVVPIVGFLAPLVLRVALDTLDLLCLPVSIPRVRDVLGH